MTKSSEPKVIEDKKDVEDFLSQYDLFLIDCDGVLWNHGKSIRSAPETLHLFRKLGKKLAFVTNNSTASRSQYVDKLKNVLNFCANTQEIVSTSYLASKYLKINHPSVKTIYLVGEDGLREELEASGLKVKGGSQHSNLHMTEKKLVSIPEEEVKEVDAVVCGWDRSFNFYKLSYACLCFQMKPEALFVATNRDSFDKVSSSRCIPGNGAMVASIEAATGREAITIGKPSPWFVQDIMKQQGIKDKSRVLMIGDRLNTDILLAKNAGIDSLLVMTGVTNEDELLEEKNKNCLPEFRISSFGRIAELSIQ